jgi:hypothetical protein
MALSDEQRVRYARHLLLPELGEAAQLRLLASHVRFAEGVEVGARGVAEEYLRRAGVGVVGGSVDVDVDVDVHEDAHAHGYVDGDGDGYVDGDGDVLLVGPPELRCDPSLLEAARALSGAFSAVEAIKALAGIGRPARLDLELFAEDV